MRSLVLQVTFINPVIERPSNLQRQRRIFPKEKGALLLIFTALGRPSLSSHTLWASSLLPV